MTTPRPKNRHTPSVVTAVTPFLLTRCSAALRCAAQTGSRWGCHQHPLKSPQPNPKRTRWIPKTVSKSWLRKPHSQHSKSIVPTPRFTSSIKRQRQLLMILQQDTPCSVVHRILFAKQLTTPVEPEPLSNFLSTSLPELSDKQQVALRW